MEFIKELGTHRTFCEIFGWYAVPIHYDTVFWVDGIKYCIGSRDDAPEYRWVFEMESGAACAPAAEDNYKGKRYTDMELVEIFLRRKKEVEDSGDCVPYRVADFNNVNKAFMALWEVTILN